MHAPDAAVGITAWGSYLPGASAVKRPEPGTHPRTAAAWDEDSFTLALEAGRRALAMHAQRGGEAAAALFVVRAGDPFEASDRALATALGLRAGVRIVALPPGADGPADALELALDGAGAQPPVTALVVGSSCCSGDGDGAAALLVGPDPLLALEGRGRSNLDFLWAGGPDGVLVPARFDLHEVIAPGARSAVQQALDGPGWPGTDVDAWALSTPGAPGVLRGMGLVDSDLGGAQPFSYAPGADLLLRLAELGRRARGGERLLAVNIGERAWAAAWRAVAAAPPEPEPGTGAPALDFAAYTRETARRDRAPGRIIDAMDYVREAGTVLRGEGVRCEACGRVTARSRVTSGTPSRDARCDACSAGVAAVELARSGTVRAFTRSHLAPDEQVAPTTYLVCDLDGGGRLMSEVAGGEDGDIAIGDRVRFVLRRGYRDHGRSLYFWKAVPDG